MNMFTDLNNNTIKDEPYKAKYVKNYFIFRLYKYGKLLIKHTHSNLNIILFLVYKTHIIYYSIGRYTYYSIRHLYNFNRKKITML